MWISETVGCIHPRSFWAQEVQGYINKQRWLASVCSGTVPKLGSQDEHRECPVMPRCAHARGACAQQELNLLLAEA